jgi:hypothetical protein
MSSVDFVAIHSDPEPVGCTGRTAPVCAGSAKAVSGIRETMQSLTGSDPRPPQLRMVWPSTCTRLRICPGLLAARIEIVMTSRCALCFQGVLVWLELLTTAQRVARVCGALLSAHAFSSKKALTSCSPVQFCISLERAFYSLDENAAALTGCVHCTKLALKTVQKVSIFRTKQLLRASTTRAGSFSKYEL